MTIISTRLHGIMDYVVGILLVVAPWLFNFAAGGAETWIPVILGVGTILYSLMTSYEYGAADIISMKGHLWIDGIAGLFLTVSPWLFDFADMVDLPHLILGLLEIGAALMTDTQTPPTPQRQKAVKQH